MSNPYYPPGHPTGRHAVEVDITCEACGHRYDVLGDYDEAVNYTDIDDAECPKCGHIDGDPVADEEEGDDE